MSPTHRVLHGSSVPPIFACSNRAGGRGKGDENEKREADQSVVRSAGWVVEGGSMRASKNMPSVCMDEKEHEESVRESACMGSLPFLGVRCNLAETARARGERVTSVTNTEWKTNKESLKKKMPPWAIVDFAGQQLSRSRAEAISNSEMCLGDWTTALVHQGAGGTCAMPGSSSV